MNGLRLQTLYRVEVDGKGLGHIFADPSIPFDVTESLIGVWTRLKPPQGDYIGIACSFWFTQEGWDRIGEVTYVRLKRAIGDRVKLHKQGYQGPVIFSDEMQVCISDTFNSRRM